MTIAAITLHPSGTPDPDLLFIALTLRDKYLPSIHTQLIRQQIGKGFYETLIARGCLIPAGPRGGEVARGALHHPWLVATTEGSPDPAAGPEQENFQALAHQHSA